MPHCDIAIVSPADLLAKRPICPHCDTPMWLVKVEPVGGNLSQRTFKCPMCEICRAKDANRPERE